MESELPSEGCGASKSLIFPEQLNSPPAPHLYPAPTESSPSRRGCPVPIYSCCLPFHWVLRCNCLKLQRFGQLLSGSKFCSRGREYGRQGRGKGDRGKGRVKGCCCQAATRETGAQACWALEAREGHTTSGPSLAPGKAKRLVFTDYCQCLAGLLALL